MNLLAWIITIFVLGGVVYNFHESAAERGFDLFELIGKMLMGIVFLLILPFLPLINRWKKRKQH